MKMNNQSNSSVLLRINWYIAAFLVLCVSCKQNKLAVSVAEKPNVIFIMADDLGFGDLGCYGQKTIKTPELDQMAREGMRFTNCYAGSPICAPSRAVLMTGQHTGHATIRGNFGQGGVVGLGGEKGRIPLLESDTTLAEILQLAGYTTGVIGKWGLGEPQTTGHPNEQGFDDFFGFINQRRAHTYFPEYIWRNKDKMTLAENENRTQKDYVHYRFTDEAVQFIQRHKSSPFFLYLPYTLPHDAYEIPDVGRFADSTHWSKEEQVYAAMVELLSKDVGRILQTLKAENIDDNTIVFFCSDNGAAQRWENRFDSSATLKGKKRDLYEGGIRTPMIIRYPKIIPANQVNDFPWYFADVLPTIAKICDAKTPTSIDGIDVSDIIYNNKNTAREDPLYWEFYERGYQQAIRWKDWKAILLHPESSWELYDLSKDEGELFNIADQYPEVVAEIKAIAEAEHQPSEHYLIKYSTNTN